MSAKRILAYMTAGCMTAVMFGGMQLSASAAADTVTIWVKDAEESRELNSTWYGYDVDDDSDLEVVFDNDKDTITFNESMTLRDIGNNYYTCLSATSSSSSKSVTLVIPEGVTLTMDNTDNAKGWSAAINANATGDLTITGGGKLVVNGGGGDMGTNNPGYGINTYGKNVTIDGIDVIVTGSNYGVGHYNGGSLTVTNGGSIEISGGEAAFESTPSVNIDEGATVVGGDSAVSTSAIDITEAASYKYVKITTAGEETPEEPTEPEETPTPLGIRVGEKALNEDDTTWTGDGVTASYDIASDTLTLSGTGSITGPGWVDTYGYGAAIYADKALNIVVAKDADITLNAGAGSGEWVCGIYTYAVNADITIGGEGKLTVNSTSDADYSVAICPYGKNADGGYDLTLTGSVNVTANGGAYGIYAWQNKAGWIQIKDSASLTAKGTEKAVLVADFFNSYIYDGEKSFIGKVDGEAWDALKVTDAKSISIKPALFTQETSPAMTGTDGNTGFVTTINGTAGTTIRNISWDITSNSTTRTLSPQTQPVITLDEDAQAVFAVIVDNLNDPNATATAVVQ